jgi:hypothetical protein
METIDTTIETTPLGETMTTQGTEMVNVLQETFTEMSNTTQTGMSEIDTTIAAAPLVQTMANQGQGLVSAQESTMTSLSIATVNGMSNVQSTLESAWGRIVGWWNAQRLSDKTVNINVRTNYSSSGSPSQYSAGVGVYGMRSIEPMNTYETRPYSSYPIPETSMFTRGNDDMAISPFSSIELPNLTMLASSGGTKQADKINLLLSKNNQLMGEMVQNMRNTGDINITIERVETNGETDIEQLAEELAYHIKKQLI